MRIELMRVGTVRFATVQVRLGIRAQLALILARTGTVRFRTVRRR